MTITVTLSTRQIMLLWEGDFLSLEVARQRQSLLIKISDSCLKWVRFVVTNRYLKHLHRKANGSIFLNTCRGSVLNRYCITFCECWCGYDKSLWIWESKEVDSCFLPRATSSAKAVIRTRVDKSIFSVGYLCTTLALWTEILF